MDTPQLQKLLLADIELTEHPGASLSRVQVIELAALYATIFATKPWCFDWKRYLQNPDHQDSATNFLETLIGYGATMIVGTHRPSKTIVGYLIILTLCEKALAGILSDLKTHGDAQPGEVYLAGFGNLPAAQQIGLGRAFMERGLQWGGSRRFWLRTRAEAVGMVKLSKIVAGMRVHKTYPAVQSGATYDRLLFVRDPISAV